MPSSKLRDNEINIKKLRHRDRDRNTETEKCRERDRKRQRDNEIKDWIDGVKRKRLLSNQTYAGSIVT